MSDITKLEQRLFELELKAFWNGHAEFGPFEKEDMFRWFFLRGIDVAKKLEKEIFVLMADRDGTMRSTNEPFGVAVKTKEEADLYVKDGGVGYRHAYEKVEIFDTKEEAIKSAFNDSR